MTPLATRGSVEETAPESLMRFTRSRLGREFRRELPSVPHDRSTALIARVVEQVATAMAALGGEVTRK